MSDTTAPANQAPAAPETPPLGGPPVRSARSADDPTPADVHVNGPDAAPKKRKKGRMSKARAALATLLSHLASEASYSGSFQDLICAVQAALEARFGYGNTWEDYPSQVATNADSVIYNRDGDTWQLSYTIGPDGDPVLGDTPVQVKSQYVPVTSSESARLFAEAPLSFTEAPEWIPFLPIPGDYKHPVWGVMSMTAERNQRFVDNFKDSVYQSKLPVDAEHQTKLSGALGWITDMRLNEDGSVDAKVEWTDRGITLVEADRFKYVSPEWYEEWEDPATEKVYSDVAIGAAVTTRPFFKEGSLRPLIASGDGLPGDTPPNQPQLPGENKNMADQNIPAAAVPVVATEDVSRTLTELRSENAKLRTDLEATRTAAEADRAAASTATTALTEAVSRIEALEATAQRKRFTEVASKWVGDREKHVDLLAQMAKSFGEDSDAFKHFVTTQDATSAQIRQAGLFTEIGSAGETSGAQSARSQLEAAAAKIREAKPTLTKEQAFSEAVVANPELVMQMREEGR